MQVKFLSESLLMITLFRIKQLAIILLTMKFYLQLGKEQQGKKLKKLSVKSMGLLLDVLKLQTTIKLKFLRLRQFLN